MIYINIYTISVSGFRYLSQLDNHTNINQQVLKYFVNLKPKCQFMVSIHLYNNLFNFLDNNFGFYLTPHLFYMSCYILNKI